MSFCEEQWFLSQVVPGQQQRSIPLVEDREGEHAAQAPHTGIAVLFVEVQNYFDVCTGSEHMTRGLQLTSQARTVVDLPVTNQVDIAAFVADGLLTAFYVDDAQPPESKCQFARIEISLVVRSPVHEGGRHRAADFDGVPTYGTGNPAHQFVPNQSSCVRGG